MRGLVFDYIVEKIAHANAQNAPLELFWSTPGLGVVQRLLSEVCWLIWSSTFVAKHYFLGLFKKGDQRHPVLFCDSHPSLPPFPYIPVKRHMA